jgi:sulfur relay protein TusB/DsrH
MSKILYFITGESQRGIELALEDTDNEVSILLLQNAVYFAQKTQGKLVGNALAQKKKVLVLKDDVESRGIQNMLHDGIQLVSYDDVPDISFEHDTIINM